MNEKILAMVGEKIREIRKSKGMSQEQLGEIADFHFSYIGRIERGQKNISLENLAKIATALNVEINQLFHYPRELAELSDKNEEIKEILMLLLKKDKDSIKRAHNILKEIFK
jgi:transcriptional regulator with XRE-family HTH domain